MSSSCLCTNAVNMDWLSLWNFWYPWFTQYFLYHTFSSPLWHIFPLKYACSCMAPSYRNQYKNFLIPSVSGNSLQLARKLGGICSGTLDSKQLVFWQDLKKKNVVYLWNKYHTLCRRLGVLEGMGGCPIAIYFLMMTRTSNFVVWCTGNQI